MKKVLTPVLILVLLLVSTGHLLYQNEKLAKELERAKGDIETVTQQSLSFKSKLEQSEEQFEILREEYDRVSVRFAEVTNEVEGLKVEKQKLVEEVERLKK